MTLVMTLLARNEEEILEVNLDYHFAQGVDFVIATDHGSTDTTPEILHDYESRGLARVFRVEGHEHHQSRRVTRMARLAAVECGADWVINNDADEFWWPRVGTLADLFSAIPEAHGQIVAERNNFLPCSVQREGEFYERLVLREKRSQNLIGEPLEPKVAHRGRPDIVVAPGNHSVGGCELTPVPRSELLEVLHYPMRDPAQFERKVLATGIGYETLPFKGQNVGRDQLKLIELQRNGTLREHFESYQLSPQQIADGLRDQTLVIDRRLASFMRELDLAGGHGFEAESIRPDSTASRAIVSELLSAAELRDAAS
jgi:hypothetical protein